MTADPTLQRLERIRASLATTPQPCAADLEWLLSQLEQALTRQDALLQWIDADIERYAEKRRTDAFEEGWVAAITEMRERLVPGGKRSR